MICEAFDDAQAKAMLTNSVLENFPQKYFVAASGMAGIGSANSIRTRQITKRFYLCGDGVSDVGDDIGLVSSRVMLCEMCIRDRLKVSDGSTSTVSELQ